MQDVFFFYFFPPFHSNVPSHCLFLILYYSARKGRGKKQIKFIQPTDQQWKSLITKAKQGNFFSLFFEIPPKDKCCCPQIRIDVTNCSSFKKLALAVLQNTNKKPSLRWMKMMYLYFQTTLKAFFWLGWISSSS